MPGAKRSLKDYERVGVSIPRAVYEELEGIMRADRRWFDRVEFVREAVKEKIERWRKDHPQWQPPARDRR